ncbi:MAG: site-2 protease family protein [Oscillospiraceae bacterium]|nr:site-2 protease family protein [Oscillospiraceae bacterium]
MDIANARLNTSRQLRNYQLSIHMGGVRLTLAISIAAIWAKVWPIAVAVLFFGFLILSHELGHFSMAKLFKIRVNEFAIGMGPKLFGFGKKETKYVLRALPFGGSVLMEGEEEATEDPRSFLAQKAWKRFLVLFAGAFVNLMCGLLIMAIILSMQAGVYSKTVHGFAEGAPSRVSGLMEGDKITKINGKTVFSSIDVFFLLSRDADGTVDLEVRRGGAKTKLKVRFSMEENTTGNASIQQDFGLFVEKIQPLNVIKYAVLESVSVARMVWLSLLDMATGKFRLSDMSGPIGVVTIISDQAKEAQQSAQEGGEAFKEALLNFLFLLALISINIGVMNLLPIPALDGGRLLFLIVEMIFRKPIPKKFEAWVHGIGLLLLLLFMLVISFSDIVSLVQGKR